MPPEIIGLIVYLVIGLAITLALYSYDFIDHQWGWRVLLKTMRNLDLFMVVFFFLMILGYPFFAFVLWLDLKLADTKPTSR